MKKNILFIVNSAGFLISHRQEVVAGLISEGFRVHVCARPDDNSQFFDKSEVKLHRLRAAPSSFSIIDNLLNFLFILRVLLIVKPDVVHLVSPEGNVLGGLAARLLRAPFIIYAISGLGSAFQFVNGDNHAKSLFGKFLFFMSIRVVNSHFIFQNTHDYAVLKSLRPIKEEMVTVLPGSGVNLKKFKPIPKPITYKKRDLRVLMAGRLLAEKGCREFMNAASTMVCQGSAKDVNFKFILAGRLEKGRFNAITELELKEWSDFGYGQYVGFKSDICELMQSADIFVYPSYYGEGLARVLCEAAACGLPIITTDHPGCRDAILPKKTGILIDAGNPAAIVSALLNVASSPQKMIKMSTAGRAYAEELFDVTKIVERHLIIYKSHFERLNTN